MDLDLKIKMYNAAVIGGAGIVGQATRHTFGIEDYFDLKGSNLTLKDIAEKRRYVFICLPTPTINGDCYVDDIKKIIKQILEYGGGQKVFIIRSTVIPGTCKRLIEECKTEAIVHNPEFLTQSTWEKDAENPDVIVLGGESDVFLEDVESLYKSRFRGSVDIFRTDTITSETIKYAVNTFYATKVIFANQIYDVCQRIGANYEKVKEVMYKRKWIGKNHLDVWFNDKRGVHGKCLPKDLEAFVNFSNSKLLKLVKEINDNIH